MRDVLITGSAATLPIDLTAGPNTCTTEVNHDSFIELACSSMTILNEDRSWMTQKFLLEWLARSTFMGQRNGMHSAIDRDNSKASVKRL